MELTPEEEAVNRAAAHRQASLLEPPMIPPLPPISSKISEQGEIVGLLQAQSLRVDQLAKTMAELFGREVQTLDQMQKTMELAQVMIAEQDRQQDELADLMQRQETAIAALAQINANLSEVVAALLGPPKG